MNNDLSILLARQKKTLLDMLDSLANTVDSEGNENLKVAIDSVKLSLEHEADD